jgi:hypothetical protein
LPLVKAIFITAITLPESHPIFYSYLTGGPLPLPCKSAPVESKLFFPDPASRRN